MVSFENINDHLVYAKAESRSDAVSMRQEAKEETLSGKCVVVFFEGRYHLYLAPGYDPYQIRKEVEDFLNPPLKKEGETPKAEVVEKKEDKNVPGRDASGKFVSKKKSVLEPEATEDSKPSKKKGFWSSLKS